MDLHSNAKIVTPSSSTLSPIGKHSAHQRRLQYQEQAVEQSTLPSSTLSQLQLSPSSTQPSLPMTYLTSDGTWKKAVAMANSKFRQVNKQATNRGEYELKLFLFYDNFNSYVK